MAAKEASIATKLVTLAVNLCEKHGAELFRDDAGGHYFYAPEFLEPNKVAYYQTLVVGSVAFRSYLRRALFNANGTNPPSASIKDASETLLAKAALGPRRKVYTRIASFDDSVVIDLGTDDRQVIHVRRDGWKIEPCPADVRFLRHGAGSLPLPLPVRSDKSLSELVPLILNVSNETSLRLLLAWWIVSLRGKAPFLVLVIRGGSGSAKSNALLVIREPIDANAATKNHLSRSIEDLQVSVKHCYVASFDNVSHINDETSDGLCVLATGGGLRRRTLHTTAEETIFTKAAPIVLNGIPDLLGRADLAARSLVIELEPISETARRTEAEINTLKQKVMPQILGRLLDVIVGVLQREGSTRPEKLPRMADVAITLTAAEEALGLETGTFIALLESQAESAADAVIETTAADLLVALAAVTKNDKGQWAGDLNQLIQHMPGADDVGKPWTRRKLGNTIRRLSDVLPRAGFNVVAPREREKAGPLRDQFVWKVERIADHAGPAAIDARATVRGHDDF